MTVSWTKVGVGAVPGSSRILTLNNVKTEDTGSYQCIVSNGNECLSAKSVPTYLRVLGKVQTTCKCRIANTGRQI